MRFVKIYKSGALGSIMAESSNAIVQLNCLMDACESAKIAAQAEPADGSAIGYSVLCSLAAACGGTASVIQVAIHANPRYRSVKQVAFLCNGGDAALAAGAFAVMSKPNQTP